MKFRDYLKGRLEFGENWFVFWNDEVWDTWDIVSEPYQPKGAFDNLYAAIDEVGKPLIKGEKLELKDDELYNLYLENL